MKRMKVPRDLHWVAWTAMVAVFGLALALALIVILARAS
jgi:hypothetical protein